jgi:hypothetical protein
MYYNYILAAQRQEVNVKNLPFVYNEDNNKNYFL